MHVARGKTLQLDFAKKFSTKIKVNVIWNTIYFVSIFNTSQFQHSMNYILLALYIWNIIGISGKIWVASQYKCNPTTTKICCSIRFQTKPILVTVTTLFSRHIEEMHRNFPLITWLCFYVTAVVGVDADDEWIKF